MQGMFFRATAFNGDISEWNVGEVTNMYAMFYQVTTFNRDISEWDVAKVTNMNYMFSGASAFSQTLCGAWKNSQASKLGMFSNSQGGLC